MVKMDLPSLTTIDELGFLPDGNLPIEDETD